MTAAQNAKKIDPKVTPKTFADEAKQQVHMPNTSESNDAGNFRVPYQSETVETASILSFACDLADQSAGLLRSGNEAAFAMSHDYYRIYALGMEVLHDSATHQADRFAGYFSKQNPLMPYGQKFAVDTLSMFNDVGRKLPEHAKLLLEVPNAAMAFFSSLCDNSFAQYRQAVTRVIDQVQDSIEALSPNR